MGRGGRDGRREGERKTSRVSGAGFEAGLGLFQGHRFVDDPASNGGESGLGGEGGRQRFGWFRVGRGRGQMVLAGGDDLEVLVVLLAESGQGGGLIGFRQVVDRLLLSLRQRLLVGDHAAGEFLKDAGTAG